MARDATISPANAFERHIASLEFPCLGAKAALGKHQLQVMEAASLSGSAEDSAIHAAIRRFVRAYRADRSLFSSFAVAFRAPLTLTEPQFERALWARLSGLSAIDQAWFAWDESVSDDPASPHFSFSLAGEAFFVVGLHPGASRAARRFEYPTLVFNPHDQFVQLRQRDLYEPLQAKIRARDIALDGEINPMLSDFGEGSEALQYSGRRLPPDWVCPFQKGG